MEFFSHPAADQHMSCVVKCMCPFCNVYLAVEMPCKLMEMIEVNCGHCKRNSYFSPIPPMIQSILSPEYQNQMASHSHSHSHSQSSFFNDYKRNHPMSPAVSCAYEPTSPKTPFVVKPPEKKHRLPSAYNRFMRDEIQRIKAAKPDIPHREAFSMAAKNWARSDPRGSPTVSSSSDLTVEQRPISLPIERGIGQKTESFDIFKQFDRKN